MSIDDDVYLAHDTLLLVSNFMSTWRSRNMLESDRKSEGLIYKIVEMFHMEVFDIEIPSGRW